MPITLDDLYDLGYKQHPHYEEFCGNVLYQRCIKDNKNNKLYYIQFYFWKFPNEPHGTMQRIEANVRFYLPENNTLVKDTGFTVNVHVADTATIEEVETFLMQIYYAHGCVPDLYNQ